MTGAGAGFSARWWAHVSGRYRVIDLDFGIRSDDRQLGTFLASLLEPFQVVGEPTHWYSFVAVEGREPRHAVFLDDQRELLMTDDHLVGVFLWHLNQRVMLETRSCLAVHAGVVAADGVAMLIPGDPDAGKSTLVAALVSAGFDYLSDEAAMLRLDHNLVQPYPRAVSLGEGSWSLVPWLRPASGHDASCAPRDLWLLKPDDLRPGAVGRPSRPGWIVFPRIAPGTPAELVALSRAEVVRRLARRSTNLVGHGTRGFEAIVTAVASSSCWDLFLDGTTQAVGALTELVTHRGRQEGGRNAPW